MKYIVFLFMIACYPAYAQHGYPPARHGDAQQDARQNYLSTVSLQTGLSWTGIFARLADHFNVVANISTRATPMLAISYDYHLTPRISIGGSIARQSFSIQYLNYTYEDSTGNKKTDDFQTDLLRMHFSIRGLFYYIRSPDRELYSGIRLGVKNWSFDTNAVNPAYRIADYINYALGTTPSFQLVLVGFRSYFTEHIGGNLEAAIGAPYFVSLGLVYRW